MGDPESILARRLGMTVHVSPPGFKLDRLQQAFPLAGSSPLEDWLLEKANARGFRVVVRPEPADPNFCAPALQDFSNEELVTAICQPQRLDRPQIRTLSRGRMETNGMNHARRILGELDARLTGAGELTLYGRAALTSRNHRKSSIKLPPGCWPACPAPRLV
jgi:hypothetical protein